MAKPKAMVLFAPGTNCEEESIHCLKLAGADADRVLVSELFEGKVPYKDYQILVLPGGFSYGDCIAAGRILANHMNTLLADVTHEFRDNDKLAIGICNGFQVLARLGLFDDGAGQVTLAQNESSKFECRWVWLAPDAGSESPYTKGIDRLMLPVAHAEGRLVATPEALAKLEKNGQVALRYANETNGGEVGYPANPNGSLNHIAGLTDKSKRIFGLMPHPERYFRREYLVNRSKSGAPNPAESVTGLKIFENAVAYFG
ncbi:MAG: phosphoribosylformylglycinamidine synthase I [Candidatus Zixiibacteriota bacterium]